MGDRVKFWTDRWCGDSPIQLTFSIVFGIASNKAAFVASCLERLGIEEWRSWDVRFIRRPNDWEMGVVDDFLRTLGSNLPPTENEDRMRWKLTKNEDFDIRSFIIIYEVPCLLSFIGKIFGRLRLLGVFLSLFGTRFLQVTICEIEGLILLTSALCVVVMGRRWTICYFIVESLIGCGA